ncbi:MAG: hydrogenase small subunit [bacterium]
MDLTRREFLKICAGSAVALGISQICIPEVVEALERAAAGNPPVLWIQGAGCTGCSVSLLNTTHPKISEILLRIISLKVHPNLMSASGDGVILSMEKTAEEAKGKYILIIEGSVPIAENGVYATVGEKNGKPVSFLKWTKKLGRDAKYVMAVGTCASYGGVPAGAPNPTGAKGVGDILGRKVINVPGCSPHPDWMVGTLVHLLLYGVPKLDENLRPTLFYGLYLHENCPNYSFYIHQKFAKNLSEKGCLVKLGCKGPLTYADCPLRQWNGGVNWCIRAFAPCIGCSQMEFPDGMSPFYGWRERKR